MVGIMKHRHFLYRKNSEKLFCVDGGCGEFFHMSEITSEKIHNQTFARRVRTQNISNTYTMTPTFFHRIWKNNLLKDLLAATSIVCCEADIDGTIVSLRMDHQHMQFFY